MRNRALYLVKEEMIYAIILILIIALDQITKIYVSAQGPAWNITVIPDIFSFRYAKNSGAAFSFLADAEWAQTAFAVLTFIILPILFIVFLRIKKEKKWLKTTLIFIIGGTIGNFIDRLIFNEVTDFIYVHFFANFNVADIFLTVGAIMLVVWFLFMDEEAVFQIGKNKKKNADG